MTDKRESLSVHLAGSWWVWRDIAVRGSGFPIDDLLRLGQPKLAMDADDSVDDAEFRVGYQTAVDESYETLAEIADSRTFRAAVLWQNPKIVHQLVEPFLAGHRAGRARKATERKREIALTKYVQRYHAKNDSVGFFGPIGWARWVDESAENPAMSVSGTHSDIVDRRAQLEHWAVRVLAEHISADPAVRPWLTPAPAPTVKLGDGRVHTPVLGWFHMPRPRIDVLAACDGRSTMTDIARRLLTAGVPGIASIEDVERVVTVLERAGHVVTSIMVPPTAHPDRFLRRRIEEIPDDDTRQRHLATLDQVQTVAQKVRNAADDPERLASVLSEFESVFSKVTGKAAGRSKSGQLVSGRALMVEDCRSAIDVSLPQPLLADLSAPLDLILTSARWLVDRVAERYLAILGDIHRGMARGTDRVGLAAICYEFWPRCTIEAIRAEAAPSVDELRSRWAQLLAVPAGTRRHRVAAADIAAAVHDQFAASSAPWLSGRFHCPDVMIAATDVEAIARGDFEWVLGEVHTAHNTLNQGVFVLSHPNPDRVRAMADEDASRVPAMIPIYPSDWPEASGRAYPPPYLISDAYDYLRFAAEPPRDAMTSSGLPISALTMLREADGQLWVEADDGRRWHPLAVLGEFMMGIAEVFQPFAPVPHRPRISIDRLVIGREQWNVPVGELTWLWLRDEADRYRAARRWAADLGLPRYVFVRVAGQPKPYYVDFTSPMLLNMIGSILRVVARDDASSLVTITEMLPGPDHLWMPHSGPDRRCTSELRLAVVDRG
ncbi:MAG TPA: lantibiotic dehydratase [Micromonosporaceae bacterium]|nr:lantibiotic dehydratase [Micromonosporaceae bacterium]